MFAHQIALTMIRELYTLRDEHIYGSMRIITSDQNEFYICINPLFRDDMIIYQENRRETHIFSRDKMERYIIKFDIKYIGLKETDNGNARYTTKFSSIF